jgi:hypothetical protein
MDWLSSSPLRLLVALTTGILIVLLTMILLPFLFVFWITYWLPHERDALLSAARCDGGEEGSTPLVDAIRRDMFIADLEKRLENRPALEQAPLPDCIEDWIAKKGLK